MARSSSPCCSYAVRLSATLLTASLLTGCSALQLDPLATDSLWSGKSEVGAMQAATSASTVKVEVRAAGRSPEFREVALVEGMCIGDALNETGLTRRFRRMDLHLVRHNQYGMAKMDSKYEHKMAKVHPRFDYAFHAGDHLVVTEDTTTMLHDMLNSLTPVPGAFDALRRRPPLDRPSRNVFQRHYRLAVPNPGSHAAFLASDFSSPFTRLLRPHWQNSVGV
jgi:hypothetical protein